MSSDSGKSMETIESKVTGTKEIIQQDIFPISFLTGINIMSEETLSRTWYWSPIEGLNPERAISKTYDFIRQEIARMNIHPETCVNPTLRRKKGIVIGVASQSCVGVSTGLYRVASHLTEKEMDTAKLAVGDDGDTIVIKEERGFKVEGRRGFKVKDRKS